MALLWKMIKENNSTKFNRSILHVFNSFLDMDSLDFLFPSFIG